MCLLALFFRAVEDAAVVAGANREEFYQRGGDPPTLLHGPVPSSVALRGRAVAGLDPTAGGTWFGVNEHGVLVAVTNRRKSRVPARPRSRGLLVRDLLGLPSAAAAAEQATRQLDQGRYAGCNLVCADARDAVVVQGGDWLRVRPLPPGLHVLTNDDVNDASDPRLAHIAWWLGQRSYRLAEECLSALRQLCAQHEPEDPPVCFRHGDHGTVSSTLVALREPLARGTYLHAQGPPDHTPYADYSHLLRQMSPSDGPQS
jgi:uncharacterized protein with NRDE domain